MSLEHYAILQQTLDLPPVDKLRAAFRQVTFLTDLDAHTLSQDGYGILVDRLNLTNAMDLQNALRGQGIETELVPQRLLPPLPPAKFVHRLDCTPQGLIIHNPLGQKFPLNWGHIMLIAAGNVRHFEQHRVHTTRSVTTYDDGLPHTEVSTQTRIAEVNHYQLEIILSRAVQRYSMNPGKFNWSYLGTRQTDDPDQNFRLLIQDMTAAAPSAALNRGAECLRAGAAEDLTYPSRNAFFEEISWLLWRLSQQAKAA